MRDMPHKRSLNNSDITVTEGLARCEVFDDWICEFVRGPNYVVCYISYPRVTYRDDPWITVTLINPRGRAHGSCDNELLQPSSTSNVSPVENSENVKLVVDLSEFGDDAVVHSESEAEIGEFDEDSEDSTDSE
ncbi:hypothetical protein DY000_02055700 [Brassica cretica]|uniref:DUF4216 domain-containing protein n=1 Tax=Brassica cretica TaxID=69181 RepID=A0ABQ7AGM0_BRACR|nr:hypothetical protein DY000_02055700 [Brassica cretica]